MKHLLTLTTLFFTSLTVLSQNISLEKLKNIELQSEETHSEALIIYQDNKLITEKYFGIGKPSTKIEAMSTTKSIVGMAVACILSDGILDSLDIPVYKYFPEWNQGQKKLITIRHLLNMTSGLQNIPNASEEIYPSNNFVQLGLCAELSSIPGEKFDYNNKSLNLMAGVIKKITGKRMDKYIGDRLFKPLGIKNFTWTLDSAGNPHVMSGCQLLPKDFIKIGLLLLNKGKYNDKQIIQEKFILQVLQPCSVYKGYGILWWIDYEKTISIIDDEKISEFKRAKLSEEFITKAILMKGVYNSEEEYVKKRKEIFGENANDYIMTNLNGLSFRKKEFAGEITYRADGYLGNYLIVNPTTKIVAIRMISHDSYKDEDKDGFDNFKELINNLTK
jgi:CubicO group peptidase (beta-lactamase class C family)